MLANVLLLLYISVCPFAILAMTNTTSTLFGSDMNETGSQNTSSANMSLNMSASASLRQRPWPAALDDASLIIFGLAMGAAVFGWIVQIICMQHMYACTFACMFVAHVCLSVTTAGGPGAWRLLLY